MITVDGLIDRLIDMRTSGEVRGDAPVLAWSPESEDVEEVRGVESAAEAALIYTED